MGYVRQKLKEQRRPSRVLCRRVTPETIASWLDLAVRRKCVRSQYNLAVSYFAGDGCEVDHAASYRWMLTAFTNGSTDAIPNLGMYCRYGIGCSPSPSLCHFYTCRAAELGHAESQFRLAGDYLSGFGVGKDAVEAFRWMKEASGTHDEAHSMLVDMLRQGVGCEADPIAAQQLVDAKLFYERCLLCVEEDHLRASQDREYFKT